MIINLYESAKMRVSSTDKNPEVQINHVSGLNNLGNTCFFNSVLQVLSQTCHLQELLISNSTTQNNQMSIEHNTEYDSELTDYEENEAIAENENDQKYHSSDNTDRTDEDEDTYECRQESDSKISHKRHRSIQVDNLRVILKEPPGIVGKQLSDVLKMMTASRSIVNPSTLLGLFSKRAPQFKGFQQQDSHELLRSLLDCIKNEELRRRQAAILEEFKLNLKHNSKTNAINNLTEKVKKKIKRYGRLSSHTLVDELFGGHLLSSIVCTQCNNCVQRVEPFLDLSLPINIKTQDELSSKLMVIPQLPGRILRSTAKKLTKKEIKLKANKKSDFLKDEDETVRRVDKCEQENENNDDQFEDEYLSKHKTKKQLKDASKKAKKAKKGTRNIMTSNLDDCEIKEKEVKSEVEGACQSEKVAEVSEELEIKKIDSQTFEDDLKKEKVIEIVKNEKAEDSKVIDDLEEKIIDLNLLNSDEKNTINNKPEIENSFRLEAMKNLGEKNSKEASESLILKENNDLFTLTLQACLSRFTSKEHLTDKIICEKCTKKQICSNPMMKNSSLSKKKVYTFAIKQYLICDLPAVLTIHLKRFQNHGYRIEKSNKHVEFPLELDLSKHVSQMCVNSGRPNKPIYSLYGIVEHSGKLNSGHYTAYVKLGKQTTKNSQFLRAHRLCHLNKIFEYWKQTEGFVKENINLNETKNGEISKDLNEISKDDYSSLSGKTEKWFYISDSHVAEVNIAKVLKTQAYILFYERTQ